MPTSILLILNDFDLTFSTVNFKEFIKLLPTNCLVFILILNIAFNK